MIPEAAVEAAAKVYNSKCFDAAWEMLPDWAQASRKEDALDLLEAAAPHMLAAAWDEAIEAHKAWTWDDENMDPLANPYRPAP